MRLLIRLAVVAMVAVALPGPAAASHPTPKVVLMKHADFIRQSTAGAQQYFVRTVKIGKEDLSAIEKEGDFVPEDPDVQFFLGEGEGGKTVGVTLFESINTPHGPLEVGLAFSPDGTISNAQVTTATVETKPWVLDAMSSGLMKRFIGLHPGDDPRRALERTKLGGMPGYMAELIATAVGRGLVLYQTLYKQSA